MKKYQTGATLIIVLIFMILIISVGAIAIRQSVTDLKIATNDQVDTLLLNTSDSLQADLEMSTNAGGQAYLQLVGAAGPFGYFMNALSDENRGDQLVFCYNPRSSTLFSFDKATVLSPGGGVKIIGSSNSNAGYCDTESSASYTNARNTTMVQSIITRPDSNQVATKAFEAMPQGRDTNVADSSSSNPLFEIYSTSVLPALSSASADSINACLKNPSRDANRFVAGVDENDNATNFDQTLSECLESQSVPHKALIQEARLSHQILSKTCIKHGDGDGSITQECQDQYQISASGVVQ